MDTANNPLTRRLFDLGVATVIVALVAVLLYIAWEKYWELHKKHITAPRLEKEKQAAAKALQAKQAAERQKAERAGEELALGVLGPAGYTFHARNQEADASLVVNGKPEAYRVKAELIVAKDGATYVAEVKNGTMDVSVRHGPTRRQLLEYSIAFKSTGVLLVDVQRKSVLRVDFPKYKIDPKPVILLDRRAMIRTLLGGLTLGAALALTITLWLIPYVRSLWPALVPPP